MSKQTTPYRGEQGASVESLGPTRAARRRGSWAAFGLIASVLGVAVLRSGPRQRVPLPRVWVASPTELSLEDVMPLSTPLTPLLAADGPESFSLVEPASESTRVGRGEELVLRFNRPVVESVAVGHEAAPGTLQFEPPVPGTARWTARATLTFVPAARTQTVTSTLRFAPSLRSLADESLEGDTARLVVFDASARLAAAASPRRVATAAPLRLAFDGTPALAGLSRQLLLFEAGGARRTLGFSLRGAGVSGRHSWVEVVPSQALLAGSRVNLAYAPEVGHTWGDGPGFMTFEVEPRPELDGVACTQGDADSGCEYGARPGVIVDIDDALSVRASHDLAPVSAENVVLRPSLANLEVSLEGARLRVRGDWAPGQVYELRLVGLRTTAGIALATPAPIAVRSLGLTPEVRSATGVVFEVGLDASLPLAAVHAEAGTSAVAEVPVGREAVAALGTLSAASTQLMADQPIAWQRGRLADVVTGIRPHRWARGSFTWTRSAHALGLVGFAPQAEGAAAVSLMQRTNLGVSLQRLRNDVLVWVTSLDRAEPVAGAEVVVQDAQGVVLARGAADRDGMALVALPASVVRAAVVVRHRDDRAVMVLGDGRGVEAAGVGLDTNIATQTTAEIVAGVFADRGVYRPGETVRAVAMVRALRGTSLRHVAGRRVRMTLVGPQGVVVDRTVRSNAAGRCDVQLVLPEGASTGTYSVQVETVTGTVIASQELAVASYRPPRMRVDLASTMQTAVHGERLPVTVEGRFLFGAPVASGRVRWRLVREAAPALPTRWQRYSFDPPAVSRMGSIAAEGEGALDADGRLALSLDARADQHTREGQRLEVTVAASTGEEVTASRAFVVQPSSLVLGVEQMEPWVGRGRALPVRVVALDAQGNPSAGHPVEVVITREGWRGWWEQGRDETGAETLRPQRAETRTVVHRCALSAALDPATCYWNPTEPGNYSIEARSTDAAGRAVVAATHTYVAAPGERPERDPPGAPVRLTPLRARWTVGEAAQIAFENPWPEAEALVTVLRDRVLYRARQRVRSGGVTLQIPLSADMVPNAFVTVSLVKPRSAQPESDGLDLGAPDLRWGAVELGVRPTRAPYRVSISAPTAPSLAGSAVPIEVTVRDDAGRPVSTDVSLWAVDEGTLRMTGYRTPDPLAQLRPRSAPSFRLDDLRRQLASRIALLPSIAASGDGESADASMRLDDSRERYEPTPLWHPHLHTDAEGRARVQFVLPPRATEYRVMALATDTGERSGSASTQLVATRRVVLQGLMPRVLVEGDRAAPRVTVQNTTEGALDARVGISVNGRVVRSETVHLEAHAASELEVALEGAGQAIALHAEAESGGARDVYDVNIPVMAAVRTHRGELFGATAGQQRLVLTRPVSQGSARDATVTLSVARHPFAGLARVRIHRGFDDSAPALAAELMSLASQRVLDAQGLSALAADRDRDRRAAAIVSRLHEVQHVDGGFGLFNDRDDASGAHESLAVALALVQARAAGWEVPDGLRDRVVTHVGGLVTNAAFENMGAHGLDQLALALRVLHDAGADRGGAVAALVARRELLTPFGLAQLALCLDARDALRLSMVRSAAELIGATGFATQSYPWFATPTRTYGAVLEASARSLDDAQIAVEVASRMRAYAHDAAQSWGNEQADGFAWLGLAALARRYEATEAPSARVMVGNTAVAAQEVRGGAQRFVLPNALFEAGAHSVMIESATPVFYHLDARWSVGLDALDRDARGRGATVHRVIEDSRGRPLADDAHVRVGDMLRVRLFVHDEGGTPDSVMLRSAVGGGFDPVEQSFATEARQAVAMLLGTGGDDDSVDARVFHALRSAESVLRRWTSPGHGWFALSDGRSGLQEYTFAVRATVPGHYVLLPAQIEALYDANYVARSTVTHLYVDR